MRRLSGQLCRERNRMPAGTLCSQVSEDARERHGDQLRPLAKASPQASFTDTLTILSQTPIGTRNTQNAAQRPEQAKKHVPLHTGGSGIRSADDDQSTDRPALPDRSPPGFLVNPATEPDIQSHMSRTAAAVAAGMAAVILAACSSAAKPGPSTPAAQAALTSAQGESICQDLAAWLPGAYKANMPRFHLGPGVRRDRSGQR